MITIMMDVIGMAETVVEVILTRSIVLFVNAWILDKLENVNIQSGKGMDIAMMGTTIVFAIGMEVIADCCSHNVKTAFCQDCECLHPKYQGTHNYQQ